MSPRKDPEKPEPAAEEAQLAKPIEKIKADNEKYFKAEMEKLHIKELKHEAKEHKLEKVEVKEHKIEKFEHKELKIEKLEHKEFKVEAKELKPEKEKQEIKEHKPELEKPPASEGFVPQGSLGDPVQLLHHAEALEEQARQIRHFIEQSERPDLSRGALRDEADTEGER